jgi:hypothetical protein
LLLVLPLVGCTTAAKQAFYEVRGAEAEVLLNQALDEDALRPYQAVHFDQPTSPFTSRICPPSLLRKYYDCCRDLQAELIEDYPGGEPALRVSSEILFFQEKGLLGSAMCLTHVQMRDQDRLMADYIVLAESKSFRKGGESAMAKASAKAVGKFLTKCKAPEEEEETHDEEEHEEEDEEEGED